MKSKCKVCGKNSEGEFCFRHKARKSLTKTVKVNQEEDVQKMRDFFLRIWNKRLHYSQVSMTYLGKEALSVFFHHILPKEKYPDAQYDEDNIILLTLEEHDQVERDIYRYEVINIKREKLIKKYERSEERV